MDYGTDTTLDASLAFTKGRQWGGIPSLVVQLGDPDADSSTWTTPTTTATTASMRFCGTGEDTTANLTLVSPTHITLGGTRGWTVLVAADINGLVLDVGTSRWFIDIVDSDNVVWPIMTGYIACNSEGGI